MLEGKFIDVKGSTDTACNGEFVPKQKKHLTTMPSLCSSLYQLWGVQVFIWCGPNWMLWSPHPHRSLSCVAGSSEFLQKVSFNNTTGLRIHRFIRKQSNHNTATLKHCSTKPLSFWNLWMSWINWDWLRCRQWEGLTKNLSSCVKIGRVKVLSVLVHRMPFFKLHVCFCRIERSSALQVNWWERTELVSTQLVGDYRNDSVHIFSH